MTKEIIKTITTTSPSKKISVNIDVWKQSQGIFGHMEVYDIESGGNAYYKTSNLTFSDNFELVDYDGNFPNGLPKYIFPILKKNGYNIDEIQSLEEED